MVADVFCCIKPGSNAVAVGGPVFFSPCEVLVYERHAKNGAIPTGQLVLWQFM
jgi:hypothetical protein